MMYDGRNHQPALNWAFEPCGPKRNAEPLTHNPEVAGSNLAARYQRKRPPESSPRAVFMPLELNHDQIATKDGDPVLYKSVG